MANHPNARIWTATPSNTRVRPRNNAATPTPNGLAQSASPPHISWASPGPGLHGLENDTDLHWLAALGTAQIGQQGGHVDTIQRRPGNDCRIRQVVKWQGVRSC